ncbi:putative transmembrane protein PGPGW [Laceyella sacchari]|jgi:uncharacterized protein|uniref:PGPGW domain-containing protein n=1 Tax=Laceyella sacchari TaxID=37482 RepID=UPI0010E65A0E|nr:PGPGW domain-containing protein [Laceyella sacchari]TCW37641.1 putative transmembrane protein PGPGW [Laceyella sacchari]
MNSTKRMLLYNIFGWFFLILGVLGLFLPFLQGILFLLIGLYLLSKSSPWAKRWLERLKSRYPKLSATFDSWIHRVEGWIIPPNKRKRNWGANSPDQE